MTDLRIASLNIWNKNYYWEKRKGLIVEAIKSINPDLIAFQEVLQEKNQNTAEVISSELKNYKVYFYPEMGHKERTSGIAILSKLPVEASHLLKLSRYMEDPLDRGNKLFGCIEVKFKNEGLVFGNTWLALSEQAQLRTIRDISFFLEEQIGIENKICIIGGDLNNSNKKPINEIKMIGKRGMVSAWEKVNNKKIATWPTSEKMFVKSWKEKHPNKELDFKIIPQKIDYIFVTKSEQIKIKQCGLFANVSDSNGIFPSDHIGLFCDIQISN